MVGYVDEAGPGQLDAYDTIASRLTFLALKPENRRYQLPSELHNGVHEENCIF